MSSVRESLDGVYDEYIRSISNVVIDVEDLFGFVDYDSSLFIDYDFNVFIDYEA